MCLVCSFVIISSWYGAGFRFGSAIFVVESWRFAEASVIVRQISYAILYPDLRVVLLCMGEELYREFNRLILFNLFNTMSVFCIRLWTPNMVSKQIVIFFLGPVKVSSKIYG